MAEAPLRAGGVSYGGEAIDALRLRAEDIVDRLLVKNEPHWRSLCARDRQTVEEVSRAVASRLLDIPADRIAAERNDAARTAYADALCRMFALDA